MVRCILGINGECPGRCQAVEFSKRAEEVNKGINILPKENIFKPGSRVLEDERFWKKYKARFRRRLSEEVTGRRMCLGQGGGPLGPFDKPVEPDL